MFVNPTEILRQLALKKEMIAVDFGCGSGAWVLPLAEILEDGKVFAVDIQEEPLSALAGKGASQGVFNIMKIRADVEKRIIGLPDKCCDLVLMTDLLFQVENKPAVFTEANRVLKKGGRVLVIDWKPEASLGPKQGRVSAEQVKDIVLQSGFQWEKDIKAGEYHYGLVFTKPSK